VLAGAGALHAQRASEPITLNFVNAEIEAVARTMAAITGRNIVVDPRVKGTITLSTDRPVPPAAGLQPVRRHAAPVRLHGGRCGRPAEGGARGRRQAAGRRRVGRLGRPRGGSQIVTQIFRLNYETPTTWCPSCGR
jgi:general secretion pathway protein D